METIEVVEEIIGRVACRTIVGCKIDIHNLKNMLHFFRQSIEEAGGHILGEIEYRVFSNGGITAVAILKESSANFHTYQERNNSVAIDVFTCGNECNPLNIIRLFAKYLGTENISDTLISKI